MKLPKKVKLVVCGSHREFLAWCQDNQVRPNDPWVRYVHDEEQLRGLRNCEVVYYGNYWNSPMFGHYYLEEVEREG